MRSWHSRRGGGLGVVHRLHERERLVHHRQTGFGRGDAGIGVLGRGLRRRHRRARLPQAQRAELRVGRDELTQRGRAGAGQADHENWPLDLLLFDLGMLAGRSPPPGAGPTRCAAEADALHHFARLGEIALRRSSTRRAAPGLHGDSRRRSRQAGLFASGASSSPASSVIARTFGSRRSRRAAIAVARSSARNPTCDSRQRVATSANGHNPRRRNRRGSRCAHSEGSPVPRCGPQYRASSRYRDRGARSRRGGCRLRRARLGDRSGSTGDGRSRSSPTTGLPIE